MRFRALLVAFAAISAAEGIAAIVAPGPFLHAIWPARQMAGAELFVRGWGACLLALAGLSWTHRHAQDPFVRRSISFALFLYFSIAATVWLVDAQATGWTLLSAGRFAALSTGAAAFGYLRFFRSAAFHRVA